MSAKFLKSTNLVGGAEHFRVTPERIEDEILRGTPTIADRYRAAPTTPEQLRNSSERAEDELFWEKPTIPEFFRGRSVFVTGGSGFMGKVLLEKLLRSCPDVGSVYVLLRDKKAVEVKDRLGVILQMPLFDRLRSENPSVFAKLVPIAGDVTQLGLGMRGEDRTILQETVSVVFHTAASVRFDDALKQAVITNVRGTREAIELALGMTKLKVFIHVSTAYCNCDQKIIGEKMYPAHGDWRKMIKLAEDDTMDQFLCSLTPKILGYLPNTYTYAKSLSEHLIKDYDHRLPVVIFRPSIVVSSFKEPMQGWIDNFNGPTGLMMGCGLGLVRTVYCDPNYMGDHVPVDHSIKALIVAAWQRAVNSEPQSVPVYNCSSMVKPISLQELSNWSDQMANVQPFRQAMWYPGFYLTTSKTLHFIQVLMLHMLPALFVDALLLTSGRKTKLTEIQKRIYVANMSLARFMFQTMIFENSRCMKLNSSVKPEDLKDFRFDEYVSDVLAYMIQCTKGAAYYLLHETLEDLALAKIHRQRLYWLHVFTKATFKLVFVYWAGSFLSSYLPQLAASFSVPHVLTPLNPYL